MVHTSNAESPVAEFPGSIFINVIDGKVLIEARFFARIESIIIAKESR
jgi:hypothetical protein